MSRASEIDAEVDAFMSRLVEKPATRKVAKMRKIPISDEAPRAPIDGMKPQAATLESERDPRNGNALRPFSIPPLPVGE